MTYADQYQWTFDLLYNDSPVIPTGWVNLIQPPEKASKGEERYDPVAGVTLWMPSYQYWKPLVISMVGPAAAELGKNSDELFVADYLDIHLQQWHGSGILIGEWELCNVKSQNIEWIMKEEDRPDVLRATFCFEKAFFTNYDTPYAQPPKVKGYLIDKMDEFFYHKAQTNYEENKKLLKEFGW